MQTNPDVRTADLQTMCGPRDDGMRIRPQAPEPAAGEPAVDGRLKRLQAAEAAEAAERWQAEQWDAERWDGLA